MDEPSTTNRVAPRQGTRNRLRRVAAIAPIARYAPRNPVLLLGAVAIGVLAVLVWRNRARIGETARPMLRNVASQGAAMRDRLPWGRTAPGPGTEVPPSVH